MSGRRDKKLNKFRRQRIWPSIVGMVISTILFGTACVILFSLYVGSSLNNKLYNAHQTVDKVAKLVEENIDEPLEAINSKLNAARGLLNRVEAVCVVDSEKNVLKQFGDGEPNFDYRLISVTDEDGFEMLADENSEVFAIEDSELTINHTKLFKKGDFASLFVKDMFTPEWGEQDWLSEKVWFVSHSSDKTYSICVETEFAITRYEILITMIFAAFSGILVLFFLIYHLSSVIKLIIAKRRVYGLLHTDLVTGGKNRYYFRRVGQRFIDRPGKRQYAVVLLRVEKYRNYCTVYGVDAGEELLERLNMIIGSKLARREIVARMDKSDFALLLNYDCDYSLTERIISIINELNYSLVGRKAVFVAGICTRNEKKADIMTLFNEAGLAARTYDPNSNENIIWFTDEMEAEQIWERKVEDEMERAVANREFAVYLQPKYKTKEERIGGAEALVRWIHPVDGLIPPYKFIPIFERNGFILTLDDYMITEVSRIQARWLQEGRELFPISVNVSRAHFTTDNLAEHICQIVDSFGVPHEFIELELTESAFFDDKDILLRTVARMKELGFKVSMDDFGSGYSSLNSLKELPLDVLKLDAEFFRGEGHLDKANLIVGETITLAKKLGMTIVAEGIETREQVDFLAELDCDLIQGYYFAKPMPINEFEKSTYGSSEDSESSTEDVNTNSSESL